MDNRENVESIPTLTTDTTTIESPFSSVISESQGPGPGAAPVTNVLLDEAALEAKVRQAMISVLSDFPGMGHLLHGHHPDPIPHPPVPDHLHPPHHVPPPLGAPVLDHAPIPPPEHVLGDQVVDHPPVRPVLGSPVIKHVPHSILTNDHHPTHRKYKPAPTPPPPTITIKELDGEPGCRSFSTKTCHKVPIVVPKKVPYDDCRAIPSIECYLVLKTVDDLECSPVRYFISFV